MTLSCLELAILHRVVALDRVSARLDKFPCDTLRWYLCREAACLRIFRSRIDLIRAAFPCFGDLSCLYKL